MINYIELQNRNFVMRKVIELRNYKKKNAKYPAIYVSVLNLWVWQHNRIKSNPRCNLFQYRRDIIELKKSLI